MLLFWLLPACRGSTLLRNELVTSADSAERAVEPTALMCLHLSAACKMATVYKKWLLKTPSRRVVTRALEGG